MLSILRNIVQEVNAARDLQEALRIIAVSYTHLTLPTTPYV